MFMIRTAIINDGSDRTLDLARKFDAGVISGQLLRRYTHGGQGHTFNELMFAGAIIFQLLAS